MSHEGQEIAEAWTQLLIYPYKHNFLLIDDGSFVDTSMQLYIKHFLNSGFFLQTLPVIPNIVAYRP